MSVTSPQTSVLFTPDSPPMPPLQSGDRLSRDEFEQRYHLAPKHIKAELVEWIVYIMVPPVSGQLAQAADRA
ncbi:hypothetical protein [Anatilimnocola floriformis]|uniref:hypothetical protein n=1 Tax=Anatilimnocola floriformis TaxID=2948575 RepID=UPI0020C41B23|nr:hypothetical protein [Anatilimnocola floriformis]